MSANQPAFVRGRNPSSKPLKASTAATTSKLSRTPSANSTVSTKSSVRDAAGKPSSSVSRSPSRGSNSDRIKVTKLSSTTVTLPTTWAKKAPAQAPESATIEGQPQTRTSDPLQIAAQVYPWSFMTSTLDACFKNAEAAATKDLDTQAEELGAEEAKIADQRERFEAERAIGVLHELGSEAFANEAPAVMQLFYSHGTACDRIETEALKLSAHAPSDSNEHVPLKVYNDMLESLEALQKEAANLQSLLIKLTDTTPVTTAVEETADGNTANSTVDAFLPHSQIVGVFAACLPILRARIANLSLAQELIDGVLENASLSLRMESMGIV